MIAPGVFTDGLHCRTNRDDGPILGRTITTDTQTVNLIVALLAILSTLGITS